MHIKDFNLEKFKSGELAKAVPHFDLIKNVIERDSFHNNDSVYNHSLNVALNVNRTVGHSDFLKKYFERPVKNSTRLELITAAAFFHDIGKVSTYKITDGITSCKGHEELGFSLVSGYLKKVEGDEEEKRIIAEIVRLHAVFYPYLEPDNQNIEKDFLRLEKELELYPELLLFCSSDIRGSQLRDNDLQLYKFKDSFLSEKLKSYLEAGLKITL